MIAGLVFLAAAATVGFGYLYLAAHFRWNQAPEPQGWDGVERRAVRGRPHLAGRPVSDAQLAEFQASLAAEYAQVAR